MQAAHNEIRGDMTGKLDSEEKVIATKEVRQLCGWDQREPETNRAVDGTHRLPLPLPDELFSRSSTSMASMRIVN